MSKQYKPYQWSQAVNDCHSIWRWCRQNATVTVRLHQQIPGTMLSLGCEMSVEDSQCQIHDVQHTVPSLLTTSCQATINNKNNNNNTITNHKILGFGHCWSNALSQLQFLMLIQHCQSYYHNFILKIRMLIHSTLILQTVVLHQIGDHSECTEQSQQNCEWKSARRDANTARCP